MITEMQIIASNGLREVTLDQCDDFSHYENYLSPLHHRMQQLLRYRNRQIIEKMFPVSLEDSCLLFDI